MKIVIFKFNHLGDNVVFVPVVQALRQRCPDWHITLLTTPNEAELYRGPLGPQEMVLCTKHAFEKSYRKPWQLAKWVWKISHQRPDACLISFDQGNVAHLAAKYSGARVRVGSLGLVRISGSLTHEVAAPPDASAAAWNWSMGRTLAQSLGADGGWPESAPPPDLRHLITGATKRQAPRKRVVFHAGASRSLNRWSAESFASVATSLARDFDVVWLTHGDSTGSAPAGSASAPVGTLTELSGWLATADLFVGNNSGPMHLANALGCHGVAVTGPSARGWDPYWHRDRWSVLRHPSLPCAPCEKLNSELSGCANVESPMACLKYWTNENVEEACRARLAQAARQT